MSADLQQCGFEPAGLTLQVLHLLLESFLPRLVLVELPTAEYEETV
jgi:hypothetical protein